MRRSAGLIFDSDYIERSRTYKEMYNVCTESLSHFERLSRDFDIRVSKLFRGLCSGQRYCGVTLSVFKSPTRRAVLSCFENFNAGRLLLQQVPWCANVAGLGLWTFGNLKKKPLMYPKVYVSKPYAPYVTQKDNIVMIVYNMPKQAVVSAFWPNSYFECEYRQQASILSFVNVKDIEDSKKHKYHCNLWWIGTYRDCYVGLFCSEVSRRKDSFFNSEFISNEEPRLCSRRVFTGMKVVWVCVVGDTEMYPTIEKFFEYCRNLDIRASKHGNSCTGEVKLAGSTLLSAQLKSENIF